MVCLFEERYPREKMGREIEEKCPTSPVWWSTKFEERD